MDTNRKLLACNLAAGLIPGQVALTNANADSGHHRYARESVEVSDHHAFNTDQCVNGATILARNFRHRNVHAQVGKRK